MPAISSGLLIYRMKKGQLEVLLVHPGGPFWSKKDLGTWSIPKGEVEEDEGLLEGAIREVREETGILVEGNFLALTPVRQKAGKIIHAWAVNAEVDTGNITSNSFELEWPPRSGTRKTFPEIDKASWFGIGEALKKINPGQSPLLHELMSILK